jgi:hypothetical protein
LLTCFSFITSSLFCSVREIDSLNQLINAKGEEKAKLLENLHQFNIYIPQKMLFRQPFNLGTYQRFRRQKPKATLQLYKQAYKQVFCISMIVVSSFGQERQSHGKRRSKDSLGLFKTLNNVGTS